MGKKLIRLAMLFLAAAFVSVAVACVGDDELDKNLIRKDDNSGKVVNLFGPMEKSDPDSENVARSAFDQTVMLAEEQLGLTVEYRTYTAENYQEKTYEIGRAHV